MVLNTLKVWCLFRCRFKFVGRSTMGPVCNIYLFLASLQDSVFQYGIKRAFSIYITCDGVFGSLADLFSTFDLPASDLLCYLQKQNFMSKCFPNFPEQPWKCLLSNFSKSEEYSRNVSILFSCLTINHLQK